MKPKLILHDTNLPPITGSSWMENVKAASLNDARNLMVINQINADVESGNVVLIECVLIEHMTRLQSLINVMNPSIKCKVLTLDVLRSFKPDTETLNVILASKQSIALMLSIFNPRQYSINISVYYSLGHTVRNVAHIVHLLAPCKNSIVRLFVDLSVHIFKRATLKTLDDFEVYGVRPSTTHDQVYIMQSLRPAKLICKIDHICPKPEYIETLGKELRMDIAAFSVGKGVYFKSIVADDVADAVAKFSKQILGYEKLKQLAAMPKFSYTFTFLINDEFETNPPDRSTQMYGVVL